MPDTLEKPPVWSQFICESADPVPKVQPVKGNGKMRPDGYVPENAEHIDALTEIVDGRCVGRDPMSLPTDVLTATGHGPRRTSRVVAAFGDVEVTDDINGYMDLRRQCLSCAENAVEVRRCAVIDCPAWPYRMGRNPHNPRRGTNPFSKKEAL